MHGTVPQKIGRVFGNLLANPNYIPRCVSHNLLGKRTPLDLEIPWFSYAAIDFLETYLRPGMTVFEYGSGGSTLFFAARTHSVYSVEDNPAWFEMVTSRLKEKNLENAVVTLKPFDFRNPVGFEQSGYFTALEGEKRDILVVDGSEEWTQVRPACFRRAERHVKPNGIIIVDDSWRYPGLRENNHAREVRVFQSVGPCRPGVTSTDVFFY